jgi:hypothetical protein
MSDGDENGSSGAPAVVGAPVRRNALETGMRRDPSSPGIEPAKEPIYVPRTHHERQKRLFQMMKRGE